MQRYDKIMENDDEERRLSDPRAWDGDESLARIPYQVRPVRKWHQGFFTRLGLSCKS